MLVQIGDSWVEADDVVMVIPEDEDKKLKTKIVFRHDNLWLKTSEHTSSAAASINDGKQNRRL